MNVELLAKIVSELILDRDEVCLPGMGVFVAELEPATFSDRGFILNPPYRRLRFEQRNSDDNSLVKAYADGNGIGEEKAAALIAEFISELKGTVLQEGTVVLPELGRLRAGRDGRILFISDENLDIPYDGIKLEPISLKAHNEEQTLKSVFADITEPEPMPAPAPAPAPSEPAPAPALEPQEPTPEPQPVEPAPEPTPAPAPAKPKRSGAWWKILLTLLTLAVIALAAFITLAQVAPDFIDSILYTPEELLIINS